MTRIATSALRPVIYLVAGRDKRDATDEVLLAVADYTQHHFGRHLRAEYVGTEGGPDLTIEIRVTENAPHRAAETLEGKEVPDAGVRRSDFRCKDSNDPSSQTEETP